jgi:lipoprotein NlpI
MRWNWLASVRLYLPSLPSYKEYDPFSAGKLQLSYAQLRRGSALFSDDDYDGAIAAFNEAIELQECLLTEKYSFRVRPALALALNNRSCAFLKKSEYDLAVPDCSRAIEYKPDFAHAFCNRGTAFLGKGDRDQAIFGYERAIDLKPDFALPFSNRGFVHFSEGNVDLASRDYDRAIQLEPDLDVALRCRAVASLCQRRFADAQKDLTEAVRVSPRDCDNVVWLYLANVRNGHGDKAQLEAQIAGRNLGKWPALGIQFLLGSLTGEALLAASADENPYKEREQHCAAHFLIGYSELVNGDLLQAASSFSKAVETGATSFLEFVVAEAELRMLKS